MPGLFLVFGVSSFNTNWIYVFHHWTHYREQSEVLYENQPVKWFYTEQCSSSISYFFLPFRLDIFGLFVCLFLLRWKDFIWFFFLIMKSIWMISKMKLSEYVTMFLITTLITTYMCRSKRLHDSGNSYHHVMVWLKSRRHWFISQPWCQSRFERM